MINTISLIKKINFLNNHIFADLDLHYPQYCFTTCIQKRYISRNLPNLKIKAVKFYENALLQKKEIILENTDKAFIYRWTNKINGKEYLGSTANSKKRLNFYFDKGSIQGVKMPIYMALLKYGYENFTFEIIEYCKPIDAVVLEQKYLDKYDFDYNINGQANSNLGYKHTETTLAKMKGRQNLKGYKHSEDNIQKAIKRQKIKETLKRRKRAEKKIDYLNLFENRSSAFMTEQSVLELEYQVASNNKSQLSSFFNLGKRRILAVKITDIQTKDSIYFNSVREARLALDISDSLIRSYAKKSEEFTIFERDSSNQIVERKVLISLF
jgi:group I intron endonuclease